MEIENKKVWVVMSKDRKVIAKGTPRNRELVFVDNLKDKKRLLTYSSKGMAESGFNKSFFYQYKIDTKYTPSDLEAVEVQMSITTI